LLTSVSDLVGLRCATVPRPAVSGRYPARARGLDRGLGTVSWSPPTHTDQRDQHVARLVDPEQPGGHLHRFESGRHADLQQVARIDDLVAARAVGQPRQIKMSGAVDVRGGKLRRQLRGAVAPSGSDSRRSCSRMRTKADRRASAVAVPEMSSPVAACQAHPCAGNAWGTAVDRGPIGSRSISKTTVARNELPAPSDSRRTLSRIRSGRGNRCVLKRCKKLRRKVMRRLAETPGGHGAGK
jgi:hypothetical protein